MSYQWAVRENAIEARDENGQIVASARIEFDTRAQHEYRAYLYAEVAPEHHHRGLGSFMLNWQESHARQYFATLPDGRARVLRIVFEDNRKDAVRLYEKHGFEFFFAEDEMHRDLTRPIPDAALPQGMEFAIWSPTDAFIAYEDAFRDRPGFPGWTEAVWRQNFTGFDSFRPDISFVVMQAHEPIAYAVCAVENGQGWIIQMGVRPVYRQQGVGGAVLTEAMRRFQAQGLATAMLEVNVNNPQAARLYESYGFRLAKRVTIYHKILH